MRGTGYAIAEIIWWMLAAGVIGFLIGWILRRWFLGKKIDAEWQTKYDAEHMRASAFEADLKTKVGELDTAQVQVEKLQVDLDGANTKVATIAGLEAALEGRNARITELERKLEAAGNPVEVAAPVALGELDQETASAMVSQIAARTRGSGARVDDDLQKIHGVGPELERLLKGMDMTSFRQVAHLTSSDVAVVAAALDVLPGRIERDDWMSSAAEQHQRKYGEPV